MMSDLLTSLSMATRALSAQQAGLDATGQNIANINTPGYVRRTVVFAEVPPVDSDSAGNGVDVVAVKAERADLLEAQIRQEQPQQGRQTAMASSLSQVENTLGAPGASVDEDLSNFYNSFSQLAQDPTSGIARQQVISQGQALATSFQTVAARLSSARTDADRQVKSSVLQINSLAAQVASYNAAIGGSVDQSAREATRDKLNEALSSLSKIIDVGVTARKDGGVDVTVGNGRPLVIGSSSYQLAVTPAAGSGLAQISTATGVDITHEISGGQVAGQIQVRDTLVPGYMTQLDQLAAAVATTVNNAHKAGYDLNGNPGVNFFNQPTAVAGAASSMAVSAAVAADGKLVAAAGAPNAGDNQNARALANLQQAALSSGSNPVDAWGSIVYRVGSDSAGAAASQSTHDQIVQQLQGLRDQVSGVSLDEEAGNMLKFQRAYEATAKYFSAIQSSLDTLMAMVNTA
jgi:flagellar hook-associated protein 1 FlgK